MFVWGFSFYLAMDVNGQLTGAKRWMLPIAKGSGRAVSWLLAVLLLTSVCFLFILCILLFSFRFVPTQIPPPPPTLAPDRAQQKITRQAFFFIIPPPPPPPHHPPLC